MFREGLTAIRDEILSRDPNALPGGDVESCYFCWYVLTRGLADGMNGGGGQVGDWTGIVLRLLTSWCKSARRSSRPDVQAQGRG